MKKNKKFLYVFVIAIGSFVSLITSVVMFAKKRKELGGFFLGLGVVAGAIGSFMQFEGRSAELLSDKCNCGDPDCADCCGEEPEDQEDCDIDEGELFSRDEEAE